MLFVYGTLLSGLGFPMHAELARRARLVGHGCVDGKLVAISWYPGLVGREGVVHGELYEPVDEKATLDFLDRYEGCHADDPQPHEYRRIRRSVARDVCGEAVRAWVYEYVAETDGLEEIGGDFRVWVQGRRRCGDSPVDQTIWS